MIADVGAGIGLRAAANPGVEVRQRGMLAEGDEGRARRSVGIVRGALLDELRSDHDETHIRIANGALQFSGREPPTDGNGNAATQRTAEEELKELDAVLVDERHTIAGHYTMSKHGVGGLARTAIQLVPGDAPAAEHEGCGLRALRCLLPQQLGNGMRHDAALGESALPLVQPL